MKSRPSTKFTMQLKNRRCPKCNAKVNNQKVRCKRCSSTISKPKKK